MLGGLSVSVGARIIEEGEWRLRKAAGLVKLLALEPGHRMHPSGLGARPRGTPRSTKGGLGEGGWDSE